ncbi:hypothetical protein G3O08_13080 [Cryomorpha ignava]|uniref:DUF748 domain-containing protein n=1 Tax=Cryomorpha ignava TaxID=101383 RepID=A0A7K3WSD8_9FLAO|nr:hypothetical protein [Cryomorpha ignava]NEN24438.1 hypothetical protein [Cryomorpha ignava]
MTKSKILLGILIAVVLLIAGLIGLETYLNNKLTNVLKNQIELQLGYEYDIDFDELSVSLIQNELSINQLSFSKSRGSEQDWIFTAGKVEFEGFRGFSFLLGKGFGVDSIVLLEPNIDIKRFAFSDFKADTTATGEPKKKKQKTDSLKVSIGGINCRRGSLNYDPEGPEQFSCDFDFIIKEIEFEGKLKNIEKLWDDSGVLLTDAKYQFSDSVYTMTVESIDLTESDSDISITNFTLESNLSKSAFPKKFGWRKSRFAAHAPIVTVSRPKNFNDSLLVISNVNLDSLYLEIHKDNRYPWPDRVTKLPQGAIAAIKMPIRVDSINFTNSAFKFIGIFDSDIPSVIDIIEINGSLAGLQNIDTVEADLFKFEATSLFMGETRLGMQLTYKYGENDPFELNAEVGETNLSFMSDFLQSVAGIRIDEGRVTKLDLHMTGNKYAERGYVDFYYTNLNITAVDKQTGEKKWLMNVLADIASGVLFWKENPNSNKFRRGDISKERTLYKGFAAQWIEGLFDGILNSVSKVDPSKVKLKKKK